MKLISLFEWRDLVNLSIVFKFVIFVMSRNAGGPLGTRNNFSDGLGMEIICCVPFLHLHGGAHEVNLLDDQVIIDRSRNCAVTLTILLVSDFVPRSTLAVAFPSAYTLVRSYGQKVISLYCPRPYHGKRGGERIDTCGIKACCCLEYSSVAPIHMQHLSSSIQKQRASAWSYAE